jgi:hypothetical protein
MCAAAARSIIARTRRQADQAGKERLRDHRNNDRLRRQRIWSAGDLARIGSTNLLPGELLCESLDVLPGERLLDVAAGHGNASLAAARRFSQVTATDFVAELLELAERRAALEHLPLTVRVAAPRIFRLPTRASTSSSRRSAPCSPPIRSAPPPSSCASAVPAGGSGWPTGGPTASSAATNNQRRTQMARQQPEHEGFGQADEIREFPNGRAELLKIGEDEVGGFIFEPGRRWSSDVKPIHSTESRPAGALDAVDGSHEQGFGMNRAERIGFWIYVAMGSVCVAVLGAAAISAIVS